MEDENGGISVLEGSVPSLRGKEKQSTAMKDEEWEVLDRKALGTIRL